MAASDIWQLIFEYDKTYHEIYSNVLFELLRRYDDGKWWIKGTHIVSTKYNDFIRLNFITRNSDEKVYTQDLHFIEVLDELKTLCRN